MDLASTMTLLELIQSLDARGIVIEVSPKFVKTGDQSPTAADAEAAKPYRTELIRIALARQAREEVQVLEQEWASYPGRRTPELVAKIARAKADILYLLPEGVPWEVVVWQRPDGTTVELAGVA